jgi:hypothetical protein
VAEWTKAPLTSIIISHHLAGLFEIELELKSLVLLVLVQQQTQPKVMTNMLKKVFNWSEIHLSEVTS